MLRETSRQFIVLTKAARGESRVAEGIAMGRAMRMSTTAVGSAASCKVRVALSATPVPTLSQWALMLLSSVLAGCAALGLRHKQQRLG